MRRNLIAMLSGDVEKVETMICSANYQPLPIAIADWAGERYYIDSYLLSYILYDALLFSDNEKDYRGRNIPELLALHKRICGQRKHPDYGMFSFVCWNDDDYLDEEEIALLKRDGASDVDIELTKVGVQHKEEHVIELLKKGASPYFLNLTEYIGRENSEIHYGYFEVAMLLAHLDAQWCDQWDINGLSLIDEDLGSLSDDDLELIVFDLFNAAASQRILYLVDKYITDEARERGARLMREYLYEEIPILRFNPTISEIVTKEEIKIVEGKNENDSKILEE